MMIVDLDLFFFQKQISMYWNLDFIFFVIFIYVFLLFHRFASASIVFLHVQISESLLHG